MDDCCNTKESELKVLAQDQRRVLIIVLLINLMMFGVVGMIISGLVLRSAVHVLRESTLHLRLEA